MSGSIDSGVFQRVQNAFLDAAQDSTAWVAAIDHAAKAFGAAGGGFLPIAGRGPGMFVTSGAQEVFDAYERDEWFKRDFRYEGMPKFLASGILVDQDLIDRDAMQKLPYYQELLRPHGFQWFAGLIVATGEGAWALTLQRETKRGPFELREQQDLLALGRVVSYAATMACSLDAARLDGFLTAYDQLGRACLVLDERLKVLQLNDAATKMLGGPIEILRDNLAVRGASRQLVDRFLARHLAHSGRAKEWLDFDMRERKLRLGAERVAHRGVTSLRPARLVVTLSWLDPEPLEALRARFGLSERELLLTGNLGRFRNLVDLANHLGLSHETARSQLKRIYQKTGVRSQTELATLLYSITGAPKDDDDNFSV